MESSTSNLMLSMKIMLISIGAVSSVIAIKSSVPLILYEFPTIWTGLISWLKPPYLYILLNSIIIIIVATSRSNRKEQQLSGEQSQPLISAGTTPVTENSVPFSRSKVSEYEPEVFEVKPLISAGTPPVYSDLVEISRSEMSEYATELVDEPEVFEEKTEPVIEPPEVNEEEGENEKFVISNSVFTSLPEVETELATEKPLVSSRFGHREPPTRTSHEGVKSLWVARQETLESIWKKITEGRHVPLTRHLNKLDRGNESPVQSIKKALDELELFEEKTEPVIEPPEVNEEEGENDECVISNSVFTPLPEVETELTTEKPLVSSRFGHRKPPMRTSHEGVVKSLRVARVKRQETLESTWKKITEGRHVPLTRHLNKLDTWQHQNQNRGNESPVQSIKKALEPSPSQDELNRRVEAFIKKFNEEMRLQREQSLQQYMEMINRGV